MINSVSLLVFGERMALKAAFLFYLINLLFHLTFNQAPLIPITFLANSLYFYLLPDVSSNKTGSKIKLVRVAVNKVTDVSQPRDCVPPNPLKQKIINPAIRTSEV